MFGLPPLLSVVLNNSLMEKRGIRRVKSNKVSGPRGCFKLDLNYTVYVMIHFNTKADSSVYHSVGSSPKNSNTVNYP